MARDTVTIKAIYLPFSPSRGAVRKQLLPREEKDYCINYVFFHRTPQ
jgi:hypothetical protein